MSSFLFNQLGQAPAITLTDLLALYTGQDVNGLPTQQISTQDLFDALVTYYIHVGFAEDDSGTNYSATYDANKTHMAVLVSNTAIETPVAGDFTGLWVPIATAEMTNHLTATDNPHAVAYDQVNDGGGGTMSLVSQAEAEAGTSNTPRWWSARRVAQAIDALAEGGGGSGSPESVRQITEVNGTWQDTTGSAISRSWDNPTLYLSTSDPAVPPPINASSGMRENFDRYSRPGVAAQVLLVVQDSASLATVDDAVSDRLIGLGCEVSYASQGDAPPAEGVYACAVVSESVGSANLNTGWDTAAIPLLTGEALALDTLRMVDSDTNAHGGTDSASQMVVAASGHIAVGDLVDGTHTIYSESNSLQDVSEVGLGAGAFTHAHRTTDTTRKVVVTYDTGSSLVTGTAPARRAFYGALIRADLWTDAGPDMFDSLLYWVAGWDY